MGHPCNIMGLCICIMSIVIALLSCQPLFIELKKKKKAKNSISHLLLQLQVMLWYSSDQWNIRRNLLTQPLLPSSTWNEEMYQYLEAGKQKSHAKDGKIDRRNLILNAIWILTSPGLPMSRSLGVYVFKSLLVRSMCSREQNPSPSDGEHKWLMITSYLFSKNVLSHSMGLDYIHEHCQKSATWRDQTLFIPSSENKCNRFLTCSN